MNDRHILLYKSMSIKLREAVEGFDDIPALEQLGLLCNVVGKMIALQDSTKYSTQLVMDVVARNIEQGNAEAVDSLMRFKGSA